MTSAALQQNSTETQQTSATPRTINTALQDTGTLLHTLYEQFRDTPFTSSEALPVTGLDSTRTLGMVLKRLSEQGQPVHGYQIVHAGSDRHKKVQRWKITASSTQPVQNSTHSRDTSTRKYMTSTRTLMTSNSTMSTSTRTSTALATLQSGLQSDLIGDTVFYWNEYLHMVPAISETLVQYWYALVNGETVRVIRAIKRASLSHHPNPVASVEAELVHSGSG